MQNMKRNSREGSALFSVMMVLLVIGTLLGITYKAAVERVFTARKLADRVRALAIAEAGANQAYSVLQTNFAARTSDTAFPQTTFAGGNFDVTVTPVSNTLAIVSSVGRFGFATEEVILDVRKEGTTNNTAYAAGSFDYTVLAGGTIVWTGASTMYGGRAHSNGEFTRSGNGLLDANVTSSTEFESKGNAGGIDGDVTAPVLNGNLSNISGTVLAQSVPLVQIPDIDLTPYYNVALANGEVRNGNVTLSSGYTPVGGVLWVNGTLSIAGNATFTGSFIATGNLSVSGNGSISALNGYPTIASRDGNISYTGAKDMTGLIYAKTGNYTQAGGNTLVGQIIVKGNYSKSGVSAVYTYADSTPTSPGGNSSVDELVGLSAWQK